MNKVKIRKYKKEDAKFLAEIFFNTVRKVKIQDYSKEQVEAWAPSESIILERCQKKWENMKPFVAIAENQIVGFAEMAFY